MSLKAIKPLSPETSVSANAETPDTTELVQGIDTSAKPLTAEQLLSVIVSLQQDNAKANAALANAILETTKPREVIKTKEQAAREANDKMFLEQARELQKRQRETRKLEQNLCEHIAGSLGETKDVHQRTSIVWHRTDAQVDIGICTTCGRQFHPEDKLDEQGRDYRYWRRKGSFNRISAAGVRQFMDPLKAQHDSYLRDEE
jgi:uncharacterized protein with PIN domain